MRVLAMLFIVAHHLTSSNIWGEISESVYYKALSVNITAAFIDCFFIVGVNVFFLLSGWLKINLRAGKIFTLLSECWVIGIISVGLSAALGTAQYSSFAEAALEAAAFPFTHWFIPAYLLLCLLSPVLNVAAGNLSDKTAAYAAAVAVVIFCVIGFAADYIFVNGMTDGGVTSKVSYTGTNAGYSVVWACVCYLIGRIARLHPVQKLQRPALCFALYFLCCMVNFAVLCVLMSGLKNGEAAKWYIYCYNNPFTFAASVFLLCAFAHLKIIGSVGKVFAFLSAHTFAVYIIHSDNPLISPYRAYLIGLAGGNLAGQVALLPINAVVLFIIGVAVSVIYSSTAGRAVSKLCRCLREKIDEKRNNRKP